MRILGIDPGLRLTGFACLEVARQSRTLAGATLIEAGVIRLNAKRAVAERLVELDEDLLDVITRVRPGALAVEKLYAHYAHPTTAIVMGHARGIVLLRARRAGLDVIELGATEVKKSLTGNGHASKSQMQDSVKMQLGLTARPEPADVADAIAIALCAMRRMAAPRR